MFAENESAILLTNIAAWRNVSNVSEVIHALPEIEGLWPREPEMYFKCLTEAIPCLSHASETNKEAAEFMLVIFTNLMKTNYPPDLTVAGSCIQLQCAAIESSFNVEAMQHNKACLLSYAQFLGDIRSLKTQNYEMRGAGMPSSADAILTRAHVPSYEFLTNAADKQAYDQLLAEDAKARAMDNFQRILVMADNGTKFMLLSYCAYFPSSNPTNVDFIKEIGRDAHLSEAERQQLEKK